MSTTHKHQESTDAPRTMPTPSIEELEQWIAEGGCYTACGCWVEPDGHYPPRQPQLPPRTRPDLTPAPGGLATRGPTCTPISQHSNREEPRDEYHTGSA